MDTIFALASARGKAGVSVVRVSGPLAFDVAAHMAGPGLEPRRPALRYLRNGGEVLDQALVLLFSHGASFTGETVAEFQLHGSVAVVTAVLRFLGSYPGLRQAEPGEFTRRALEAGRLDLPQVEALADLIEAETDAQRRLAMRGLSGALGELAGQWRAMLVEASALVAVTIDFSDEDVPDDLADEVLQRLDPVILALRREVAGSVVAERIRDGFEVAIVGRPNAGKSTLLNALAGRAAAITSEVAGTTRDVIEVRMDIRGLPVTLLDTAGLRETEDVVEALGVTLAVSRAEAADLRIYLLEPGQALPDGVELRPGDIALQGKGDLTGQGISGRTGLGIDALLDRIAGELSDRVAVSMTATRERHRIAMMAALGAMESARDEVLAGPARADLAAEELRQAARALDALVGRVDVEDLLDHIFSSFCIGK